VPNLPSGTDLPRSFRRPTHHRPLLTLSSLEPARRIELRLPPYHGGVLPLPLSRQELGKRDSDAHLKASRACGMPLPHSPSGASSRTRTGTFCVQGRRASDCAKEANPGVLRPTPRGAARIRDRTLGGSRTRINVALDHARLPACGTSAWSRHPVPTRISRLTGARSQPCVTASLPGLESNQRALGSEPRRDASNPPGISAEGAIRTHRPRGLSSRGRPVPVTPAWCATWDLNPELSP
jgi:hypothetical protein